MLSTAGALVGGALLWYAGARFGPADGGTYLGLLAFPALLILLLWAPGLLVDHLVLTPTVGAPPPWLAWGVAFACSLIVWSPVARRVCGPVHHSKDRWFLAALLLLVWSAVSDLAIGGSRGAYPEPYGVILAVAVLYLGALGVHVWRSGGLEPPRRDERPGASRA